MTCSRLAFAALFALPAIAVAQTTPQTDPSLSEKARIAGASAWAW
ncbi:hypothetical protein ABFU55_06835 [Xanthomonas campestris pv. raphani]